MDNQRKRCGIRVCVKNIHLGGHSFDKRARHKNHIGGDIKGKAGMTEYQDILRYLFQNPPKREPDKQIHASLLEMLAKKLRGEDVKPEEKILKSAFSPLNRKYH